MVVLKEIVVKNFKSFKGEARVSDVLPFTAIVGCNGAGKSNLMDAISFAMGVDIANLRVSKVGDLVSRSGFGERERNMLVKVVLRSADGVETLFQCLVEKSACQYCINDTVVSHNDYVEALKLLGIDGTIKNFLVFQNSVESIVTKSPVERTAMFESISGSGLLATEYNHLQHQVLQLNQDLQCLQQDRRSVSAEIKALLYCKEKAKEYELLKKKLDNAQINLMLFNLYDIERNIQQSNSAIEETSAKILGLESEKYEANKKLTAAKRAIERYKIEATRIESNTRAMETELLEKVNDVTEVKAAVQHARDRVALCTKSLESARTAERARKESVKDLEEAQKTVAHKLDEYSRRFSNSLGRDVRLRESQIEEYEALKAQCLESLSEHHQRLMCLERQRKSVEDKSEAVQRRRDELRNSVNRETALHLTSMKRAKTYEELVKATERELAEKRRSQRELLTVVDSSKSKERALSQELEEVHRQIGDSKVNERTKEKNAVVDNLRQTDPDVLDRLQNLCRPIHERYKLAVAKALGRHFEAIVVDTSESARRCINRLRDRRVGVETFLPLDSIQPEPLSQKLRDIRDPPNVKLLYDVVECEPRIRPVVQFVARNTLVCELPEHAAEIAFAAERRNRHDCISVGGIFYRKSGLMSGGAHDLATKAQRWDSSLKETLLSRKAKLVATLRELRSAFPKETELSAALTIAALEKRLEYANKDYQSASRQASTIELHLQELEDNLDAVMREWEGAQSKMSELSSKIDRVKSNIGEGEKEFFADFCKNIGVEDVHRYEEEQKLYKETMQNFDYQLDRISKQLDLERGRNTGNNIARWEQHLREAERELQSHLDREAEKLTTIREEKERAYDYEMQYKSAQRNIESKSNEMVEVKSKIRALAKEHSRLSGQVNGLRASIERKSAHRHSILTEAKMRDLFIPLIDAPPDESSDTNSTALDRSSFASRRESGAKFDFSGLPIDPSTLESNAKIRAAREELEKSVDEIVVAIEAIADPNTRTSQRVQYLKDKLAELKFKIERTGKNARRARLDFERVKKDRYDRFATFFEHASKQVDLIYKELTKRPSAQAYLLSENPEEPYLGGTHYHCIIPGKRFQSTSSLSGGEKTLAALPLLFAVHSGDSPPFKVLDEIDAALDNKNATKVASYINKHKDMQQTIVISHKIEISRFADALLGIDTANTEEGVESRIIALDLTRYKR